MPEPVVPPGLEPLPRLELTEVDIYEAMKLIPGYLDITPGDFKEIYSRAYEHALERLRRSVQAKDIMTRDVVAARTSTPLAEVAALLGERGVAGLPVLDQDDKVAGVISEKDFLEHMGVPEPRNFMRLVAHCLATRKCLALPVKQKLAMDIMVSPPLCIQEDTCLEEIARLFTAHHINRAPVVDTGGRLVGLVSRADLVRAILDGGRP